jgi:DNA (cytosine-5)-methyltransferase 1|nr:DNA (cytosine-5-)-methyltransferase [Dolichospermum sp. UHCC 0260]
MFVDIFSGAGGLALGFKWAGWQPIVANDIERIALETYAKNIDSSVIVGDIRDDQVFSKIVSLAIAARQSKPDSKLFILGGPPCQGFSTAGNARSMQDERNSLFKNYQQIIEAINPDGFVFENVMGLLSMENGLVFQQIKTALESVTDNLSTWKVDTANYGIPQRRKRVILIGLQQEKQPIPPPTPVCDSDGSGLLGLSPVVRVDEAISDLPPLEAGQDGEHLDYIMPALTKYQSLMRNIITPAQYLKKLHDKEIYTSVSIQGLN